jgi:enoyl-CoA hydratase
MNHLSFQKRDRVGILKINRPEALNALNQALLEELDQFLSGGIKPAGIRVLILTGEGKAFIAGADIKEMQAFDGAGTRAFCNLGHKVMGLLETVEVVTIAAINGFALGGGLELALACDFAYASSTAKMGLPEVSLGVTPGFGGTQRLPRAVGVRQAQEMIATGQFLDASEALRIGLVNKVVEPDNLLDETLATAEKIIQNSLSAVLRARGVVRDGAGLPLDQALELEKKAFLACFSTKDQAEGMAAFIDKRKPNFESQ